MEDLGAAVIGFETADSISKAVEYAKQAVAQTTLPVLAQLYVDPAAQGKAADPLVPLAGGQDTAASIPGARLMTIPGMGHDLPLALVDALADAVAGHARELAAAA